MYYFGTYAAIFSDLPILDITTQIWQKYPTNQYFGLMQHQQYEYLTSK